MVSSLCPLCEEIIDARIFQEGNAILMEKRCSAHGDFRDILWSDAAMYRRFMRYWSDGSGVENPILAGRNCPLNCGLCENHKTSTILGNIDVTDRCNLSCPVCFADTG
jgi:uncharacterized radical SAM superfamily Fe-S cluster-containing enzyme